MKEFAKFYIDGQWLASGSERQIDVVDPVTGTASGTLVVGGNEDVDRAVGAARHAFEEFSYSNREERLALLGKVLAEYERRYADVAAALSADIGVPEWFAEQAQAATGLAHLQVGIEALKTYEFETTVGTTIVEKAPVGVCGLITPWNWPINQIACKVVPAIAAGCTVVLKPSELAPRSAQVWAEIMDGANLPAGVFNMVLGDGDTGARIASHDGVDMLSFTGSTRAGVEVAKAGAPGVKRICQELGGKSANIILDDAELGSAVPAGIVGVCLNAGQSCNAPTRMLVPNHMLEDAVAIAKAAVNKIEVGPPDANGTMGPVVSRTQWHKIQDCIEAGIAEGARLISGGTGRPAGLEEGFFVRPTVFADVTNDMRIAREEIFGPVLVIIGYDDEEDAIRIANDTEYGLAAYVQSSDTERAIRVGRRLAAGQVMINRTSIELNDFKAPFGGFKKSGNGREWGMYGLHDFLEFRAILGAGRKA